MEYLRGNATASPMAIFVICRYLSGSPQGLSESEIRRSLENRVEAGDDTEGGSSVLNSSLVVGEGLGIIGRETVATPFMLDQSIADGLKSADDSWAWFRAELAFRVAQQGARQRETHKVPPDLVLGLTWFLQLDPLTPLMSDWSQGPEPLLIRSSFKAVSNPEQWRAFRRWASALGFSRNSEQAHARVTIPDATTAVRDQLPHLPQSGSATEWLRKLYDRLPVLGSIELREHVPRTVSENDEVSPALVLGLLKLERAGAISLETSDDATDVVVLNLGKTSRQVGRVRVNGL